MIANQQYSSRCVRRDANHGCDPRFTEDPPTGSTSVVMVSLV